PPSLYTLQPPPSSTLSPYTTLFRSHQDPSEEEARGQGRCPVPLGGLLHPWMAAGSIAESPLFPQLHVAGGLSPEMRSKSIFQTPDRKSTRLNSSHQIISYAVFCLKK